MSSSTSLTLPNDHELRFPEEWNTPIPSGISEALVNIARGFRSHPAQMLADAILNKWVCGLAGGESIASVNARFRASAETIANRTGFDAGELILRALLRYQAAHLKQGGQSFLRFGPV